FTPDTLVELGARFRKPRDIIRVCHNVWELAQREGKEPITPEMIRAVVPSVNEREVVKGGTLSPAGEKSTEILEYIKNHPGSMRGEIAKALSMNPNSVTNLLKILMEKGLVSRTDDFKHYAGGGTKEGEIKGVG
ncbi:MAG: MarR family transcriptional regulator, partial [Candidatus Micrarchaeota archaeon]